MYTAIEVANYVIERCASQGHPVSYFRLQNLLYCIRKEFLSMGEDIFTDPIEAGQSGPLVRSVHNRYCAFASRGISMRFSTSIQETHALIINQVIDKYHSLPPWDMAKLTQPKGGAWETVYDGGKGKFRIISPNLIAAE